MAMDAWNGAMEESIVAVGKRETAGGAVYKPMRTALSFIVACGLRMNQLARTRSPAVLALLVWNTTQDCETKLMLGPDFD